MRSENANRGLCVAALLVAMLAASGAIAQSFELRPGRAVVVDGDTLRIGSQRVRLSAIDAPELSQICRAKGGVGTLCGRDSRNALAALIRAGIRCTVETQDRYGRAVAACTNAAGQDIGQEMIRKGWAVPYWRYGGARYARALNEATAGGAGMHAGAFIDPEQWRRGERW